MDESDWLTSVDPAAMLEAGRKWIAEPPQGPPLKMLFSDRKLRLFACACCREVWHLLTDPRSRAAVEVAEKYADGLATAQGLLTASHHANEAMVQAANPFEMELAWRCVGEIGRLIENSGLPRWFSVSTKHAATQAALLRCIVGNPFAPTPYQTLIATMPQGEPQRVWQSWLTWNSGTIPKIAAAIYEDRAWRRLPVLADCLEEAGCVDEPCPNCGGRTWQAVYDIGGSLAGNEACGGCGGTGRIPNPLLAHLRTPGPHARGCWCVDLILGKE